MSAEEEATDEVCAYCGKAEIDEIKLKKCACNLVKYCGVGCQKNHRQQHKKACKKRVKEIRDDKLFTQPDESYLGECPICCLPLSLDANNNTVNSCCCKFICLGCDYANKKREMEAALEQKCTYCREPLPDTDEEYDQNLMKRVKADDPVGMFQMGSVCYNQGDCEGAIQYWTKAAALGNLDAHYNLSVMYREGGEVEKNEEKEVYHLEEAAIGGHHLARSSLGCYEGNAVRHDIAMRHFIIAAKLGYDDALEDVKKGFQRGFVSKEDYASALRGHQAAVDATKSEQREEAYAWFQQNGNKKSTEGGSRRTL